MTTYSGSTTCHVSYQALSTYNIAWISQKLSGVGTKLIEVIKGKFT